MSAKEIAYELGYEDPAYFSRLFHASPYATTQAITALRDLDRRPVLGKINMPVAIFHGTKDKLCDFVFAEQLHKGIKNSYIVKFENSGHALFVEEMEKFNTELEKFARS